MEFLPVSIRINDRTIVMIGGGKVALHKLKTLLLYTRHILVCAPLIEEAIRDSGIQVMQKEYEPSMPERAWLVYACTNDKELNQRIARDARQKGILVNVADSPGDSDFVSPAIYKKEIMSIAVSSDAKDVKMAVKLRDKIRGLICDHF